MTNAARGLGLSISGVGLTIALGGMTACQFDCPTYITSRPGVAVDAGPETSTPSSTGTGGASAGGSAGDGGTCAAGDFTKPDVSTLTACGNGKGHCFDKTKVPIAADLVACTDASQVCVPDEILAAGGGTLQTCTSIIGAGGCVNASLIPEIEQQGGSALKQDVCAAGLTCVPCNDPTNGNAPTPFCQPIGVRTEGCAAASTTNADASAPAPTPLPACCTTNGHSSGVCLTESAVPSAQRDQTIQDTCGAGDKCLPAAFVSGKPVTCSAGLLGGGVCMDKCFNQLMSFAGDIGVLGMDVCGSTEVCVPCSAVSGQGVPGCK